MEVTKGPAKNVRHTTNQEHIGSGENKRTKTVHSVLFEIGRIIVKHKQDRDQIPISDGDELTVVYRKKGNPPKNCLAYDNHSNGAALYPSARMDWVRVVALVALFVATFAYPKPFLAGAMLPNTEISFAWFPRILFLLLAAVYLRSALRIGNIRSLLRP